MMLNRFLCYPNVGFSLLIWSLDFHVFFVLFWVFFFYNYLSINTHAIREHWIFNTIFVYLDSLMVLYCFGLELKRPNASVNCSSPVTKNRGDEFACLCVGNGGYPPPTASWFKDGKNVSGRGYLNKAFSLRDISKKDTGTYSCVVDSYGLNDTEEIEIQVQCKLISLLYEI